MLSTENVVPSVSGIVLIGPIAGPITDRAVLRRSGETSFHFVDAITKKRGRAEGPVFQRDFVFV